MAIMSIGGTPPSEDRALTVEDLARMPDDEPYRYELVGGRLEVSPAPVLPHVRVQHRLAFHLECAANDEVEIVNEPGVVLNGTGTHYRQPDVAVLRAQDVGKRWVIRPPLLVVEVLSLSSAIRDLNVKRREYAKFGVPSYWIINPDDDNPSILELRLDGGEYRTAAEVDGMEVFATDAPFPVRFVPYWLIADGPWRARLSGD